MALRPQSPLCPRSRQQPLVVRPAGGAGLPQPLLVTSRFTRSRIVRCMATSSDSPNRKSRRTISPHVEVISSRGYTPRLTVELSTKKREDEETVGTYNRLFSTDATEWTGSREAGTAEADTPQNASTGSIMGEGDVVDQDIFEVDTPSSVTAGRVDAAGKAGVEQDIFEVDLSATALSSAIIGGLDMMDEDGAVQEQESFEAVLSGNVSSSPTIGEVDVVDEAGPAQDTFEVTVSGNVSTSAMMGEMDAVDEAGSDHDSAETYLSGKGSSSVLMMGLNAVDEVGADYDIFNIDLSGNVSRSATMGEVEAVDEAGTDHGTFGTYLSIAATGEVGVVDEAGVDRDIFETDLSGNVSRSAATGQVNAVDEAGADQDKFKVNLSGNIAISVAHEEVDVMDDARAEGTLEMDLSGSVSGNDEEEAYEQLYPALSTIPMGGNAMDKTPVCLKPELTLVRVHEQGESNLSVHEQEESTVTFYEQNQLAIPFREQELTIIAFDKQNLPTAKFPKQDQSIAALSEQKKSIVASYRQDRSILDLPEQHQSIIGSHKHDKSIADASEQIHSIVGSFKQRQSIVAFRKQDQAIVSVPKQKQSIVAFRKQDLSIVGLQKQNVSIIDTSGEEQTKQVAVIDRHDALHMKGVEAKDEYYTYQKDGGHALHVNFDVDNLLQKHQTERTEEAVGMTTSKKVNEEHISMTEDQIGAAKEQMIVTEDGLSMNEVGTGVGDKVEHLLSEEELSQAEDEVGLIEDDGQYEVDETSVSVEPDIQELPQDVVDPHELQRMLQELAGKNYSMGNKLFVFPEVVKADSVIDLYLNRDLTALASEPDVVIKGAFNGWKWRLFTERLNKSDLGGVWWSCKLYIPKEAYRLDFVFFNGRSVYENNGNNDFFIEIESTMDEDIFEDFLVKEKQRELERLAIEEAERRTQTEEQRRRKEEKAADEAIWAQVKAEVETKKNKLHNMLSLARTCVDNLWYTDTSTDTRGDTVRLYYNRNSRPLMYSTEIWMHGGYNNWTDGLSIVERLVKCNDKNGDWWHADVILPEKALVLDWVLADGPPGNARTYDNNGRQDFHAILPNVWTEEGYWVQEEHNIYTRLLQERREREEAIKRKTERSAKMKAEMKAKTMRRFLLSQKHIVYTEPLEICAGTTVEIIYNPSNTVLNGKPEVWFRGSFNLWMHPSGALPPQKMVKVQDGSLLKATVSVPPDAYMLDFVFSESEDGGIYDNRNGMDYHIPVSDSIGTEDHMHIVHIAVEMAPIAKVGGLGDVVTSLSRAVQDLGHTVEVILPKYDCLKQSSVKNLHLYTSFSWGGTEIKVWTGLVEDLLVYFLEPQNGMFEVGCVYGRNDDRRFGFFCHSALEFLLQNGSSPHIIHCHDWSSAPVAWIYKEHYAQSRLASARVVFTIHNLEFGAQYISKAMAYCDKATTVSHTYSREVTGHGAIAPHREKFYGILNGIDQDIWDPYTDDFLPVSYTSENVVEGKSAAKRALQQKFGLQQTDVPIVGIITRLTPQKGIHLIKHAIHRTLESNGQVVLLGSAPDPRIQGDFCRLADSLHGVYHGRVKLALTYDEPLSRLIYAGSDFILVPSIFEPCGLTQLVAMRYGSVPIVRKTGGLYDTVFDVDNDRERARSLGLEPNGFSFNGADSNGVDYALNRAIAAWFDARDWFHSLCKRVMEQDWSWNRPALDYIELYHSARKF